MPKQNTAPTHVIWAETAVPFNLSADPIMRQMISAIVPHKGLLITGAPRIEISENIEPRLYNSIYALDETGNIKASYDKQHLVPFGEYVPMPWLFRLSKLTDGRIDFHPGKTEPLVNLTGLPPAAMLICYEIIFPKLTQSSDDKTNLIVNISEDAWFGNSIGPYQHFTKAIFRSVENNTYLARSANKGISAFINNNGETIKRLEPNETGNIELDVPLIENNRKNKNDLIFFVLLFTYLFIFLIFKNKN